METKKVLLEETVPDMLSSDFKARAQAELDQLTIRIDGIKRMLDDWSAGKLTYTPLNPKFLSVAQLQAMITYRCILEERLKYVFGEKTL